MNPDDLNPQVAQAQTTQSQVPQQAQSANSSMPQSAVPAQQVSYNASQVPSSLMEVGAAGANRAPKVMLWWAVGIIVFVALIVVGWFGYSAFTGKNPSAISFGTCDSGIISGEKDLKSIDQLTPCLKKTIITLPDDYSTSSLAKRFALDRKFNLDFLKEETTTAASTFTAPYESALSPGSFARINFDVLADNNQFDRGNEGNLNGFIEDRKEDDKEDLERYVSFNQYEKISFSQDVKDVNGNAKLLISKIEYKFDDTVAHFDKYRVFYYQKTKTTGPPMFKSININFEEAGLTFMDVTLNAEHVEDGLYKKESKKYESIINKIAKSINVEIKASDTSGQTKVELID